MFRVAISNNRIVKLEEGRVTFKYKDSATDQTRFCTVSSEEFIRRFLQHVLPERFVKVRYYGLMSPGNRALLEKAKILLIGRERKGADRSANKIEVEEEGSSDQGLLCPGCGAKLVERGVLKRIGRSPPRS